MFNPISCSSSRSLWRRFAIIPLLLFAFSREGKAELRFVPFQYPTLQSAINASNPKDVILVASASSGPIVVDKPLTIMGYPSTNIQLSPADCLLGTAGITLAGNGSGRVVLANVTAFLSLDCDVAPVPVTGGGFDELVIYSSYFYSDLIGPFSFDIGTPAIEVNVPRVVLNNVLLSGTAPWGGDCLTDFSTEESQPAIYAPNSEVILMDVTASPGQMEQNCCWTLCQTCPSPEQVIGGDSVPTVIANSLYVANSLITGGTGAEVSVMDSNGEVAYCAPGASSPVIQSESLLNWENDLLTIGSNVVPIGGTINLSTPALPTTFVLIAGFPSSPITVPGLGTLAVNLSTLLSLGVYTVSPFTPTLNLSIPDDLSLIGKEVTFQAFNLSTGLSRPHGFIIGPKPLPTP